MEALRRNLDGTRVENIPLPKPKKNQSLVKVQLAGICRTDIYAAQGKIPLEKPVTIGHEFSGTIIESRTFRTGAFVSAFPFVDCKKCEGCTNSNESCHEKIMIGLGVDGAFAQYLVTDDDVLFEVPTCVSKKRAAFLEPIAAALAPAQALRDRKNKKGYLVGLGRIAALNSMILNAYEFTDFYSGSGEEIREASMDWVIEADPTRINKALRLVRPGGTLIAKSRPANLVNFDIALAVKREITIQGVHYAKFEDAVKLVEDDTIPFESLFGETFSLGEHEKAFSRR